MPYGTMDKQTEMTLKAAGIEPDKILFEDEEGSAIDISVVIEGALDESFLVKMDCDFRRVVDVLAADLIETLPGQDVEVSSSHVYVGEVIEASGYLDDSHTRRSQQ